MPTPVPRYVHAVDSRAQSVPGQEYYPFNRHRQSRDQTGGLPEGRNRLVVKGGKRMKVPIALEERPEWSVGSASRRVPMKGDWSDLRNLDVALKELVDGKHVETRLHAAFGLARCCEAKANRVPLASTPGAIEALGHVLMHAEPTESGRRCQFHALTVLHNILLESPKVDVFIGHDETVLRGLLRCLQEGDAGVQELAITCVDFLSISEPNQNVLCFTNGLLDALTALLRTTTNGFAVYHGLHALTYLTTSRSTHHTMARHGGVLEVLLGTMSEHSDDPARCQQGLVAMCNLASQPENALAIQTAYNVDELVDAILRQSQDEEVLSYCEELLQRLQPNPLATPDVSRIEQDPPSTQSKLKSKSAASPDQPKHRVSFNDDSLLGAVGPEDAMPVEGADGDKSWRRNWDDFDRRWQSMRQEVMGKEMPGVARPPSVARGLSLSPPRGEGGGQPSSDPLALLDRYEAELNATMAEIDKDSNFLGKRSPRSDALSSDPLAHIAPIAATVRVPKVEPVSRFKHFSPPRPPAFASLNLGDSDDERHVRGGAGGRYGLGTFAASSPPTRSLTSDLWSVSGESDI